MTPKVIVSRCFVVRWKASLYIDSRLLYRTIRYTGKWIINDNRFHLSHFSLGIISNTAFSDWVYSWWFCHKIFVTSRLYHPLKFWPLKHPLYFFKRPKAFQFPIYLFEIWVLNMTILFHSIGSLVQLYQGRPI